MNYFFCDGTMHETLVCFFRSILVWIFIVRKCFEIHFGCEFIQFYPIYVHSVDFSLE